MDESKLDRVIEGLKVCTNPATKRGCLDGLCPYDGKGCRSAMERDALELLQAQKWISVKERYPDKEGFYLVSADHGNYLPWIAEMKIFGGVKGFCNGATMPCVGAWMPLPEPYFIDKCY